jgi:hypothetical protein
MVSKYKTPSCGDYAWLSCNMSAALPELRFLFAKHTFCFYIRVVYRVHVFVITLQLFSDVTHIMIHMFHCPTTTSRAYLHFLYSLLLTQHIYRP